MTSQRKPHLVRLSQTQDLISKYEQACLHHHRNLSFLSQMAARLKSKKSLSKRQRDWLDSLIDEGVPACKNHDLCERIMSAINVEEMSFHRSVLESFYQQAYDGKVFTEKQESYLESLLSKAKDFISGNFWKPSRVQFEDAKICLKLAKDFDSLWVHSHPGFAISWKEVEDYVVGRRKSISERRFLQFMKWTSKKLSDYKNPRFSSGMMAWVHSDDAWRIQRANGDTPKAMFSTDSPGPIRVLVTSDAYVSDGGQIKNDVLIGGTILSVRQDLIKKRR